MNTQKNMVKMILLSLLIAAVNIFCFSKAGLGLSFFSPSVFQKSLSITIFLMSIGVFGYAGFHLMIKEEPMQEETLEEEVLEDETESSAVRYLKKMKESLKTRTFAYNEVEKASLQYDEFMRKKQSLQELIALHDFKAAERFSSTADDVENCLAKNFRLMLTRLVILDYDDEARYKSKYCGYMSERLQKNEEILNHFDVFLDELSRMKDEDTENFRENINLQAAIDVLKGLRNENEQDSGYSSLFDLDDERLKLVSHSKDAIDVIYVDEQEPNKHSQTYPPQN